MLHQRIAAVLADKAVMLHGHVDHINAENQAAAALVKQLRDKIADLKSSVAKNQDQGNAELLSARELLKSAKEIHFSAQEADEPKKLSLGKRLKHSLKKAHHMINADSIALARAEWKLHELTGYQGDTDPLSRIAEDIKTAA